MIRNGPLAAVPPMPITHSPNGVVTVSVGSENICQRLQFDFWPAFLVLAAILVFLAVLSHNLHPLNLKVPLLLQKVGSKMQFPTSYSLELRDRMSPSEFQDIISILNAAASEHGPDYGALSTALVVFPLTHIYAKISRRRKV